FGNAMLAREALVANDDQRQDDGRLRQPVDLLGALRQANPSSVVTAEVGWVPPYVAFTDAVSEVAPRVRAGAGAGRLAVGAD
ncbi:MAG: hypothetical protein IPP87_07315, partial [Ideonella sp.]|nr:hypothetical protein [Ideonella sp.]